MIRRTGTRQCRIHFELNIHNIHEAVAVEITYCGGAAPTLWSMNSRTSAMSIAPSPFKSHADPSRCPVSSFCRTSRLYTEIRLGIPRITRIVVSFTATSWTSLLRRPRGYPQGGRLPTAGMCYRFVMSNPAVHVCLMAPGNLRQFEQNLAEIRQAPLHAEDMQFMRNFGDLVYGRKQYFM